MENEVNILAEEKPKSITLADGKDYMLPPMDLTTLANIEKTMGMGGKKIASQIEAEPLQTIRLFCYALLKESHPDLKLEQAGRLIGVKEIPQFAEVISTFMAVSG